MTDRELMQQALDAFESCRAADRADVMTALRERLAQPEPEQKPAAWAWYVDSGAGHVSCGTDFIKTSIPFARHIPLYTAPPQRTPLTAPQIHELYWPDGVAFEDILEFTRAIERAHGIGEKE